MAPELNVILAEDVTVGAILDLHEEGICFNVNDGSISEVIF